MVSRQLSINSFNNKNKKQKGILGYLHQFGLEELLPNLQHTRNMLITVTYFIIDSWKFAHLNPYVNIFLLFFFFFVQAVYILYALLDRKWQACFCVKHRKALYDDMLLVLQSPQHQQNNSFLDIIHRNSKLTRLHRNGNKANVKSAFESIKTIKINSKLAHCILTITAVQMHHHIPSNSSSTEFSDPYSTLSPPWM